MNLFRQPKSKRFNYIPKHIKDEKKDFENDFEAKWKDLSQTNRRRRKKQSVLPLLIAVLGLLILIWFILKNYEN